ncbi:hypothetical protein BpHYR1_024797 [Brachionus plicatilis]|uniref:Uncharacterized protein n=1 Tax=Brachionus plicatilis TaxID=10195 RepID=A0A3M7P3M2_BRAPC|nr:hypothetical protein BpHYR1_024797 [Brachionus plicatilis]
MELAQKQLEQVCKHLFLFIGTYKPFHTECFRSIIEEISHILLYPLVVLIKDLINKNVSHSLVEYLKQIKRLLPKNVSVWMKILQASQLTRIFDSYVLEDLNIIKKYDTSLDTYNGALSLKAHMLIIFLIPKIL